MTPEPIIEVKNLSKRYDIMHQRGRYITLRDVMTNVLKSPFSFIKSKAKKAIGLEKTEEFWALKKVSFEVMPGEVVGIIGANGAGKSTLLKILTGITPPTEGEAIMRGRVSSLLEVGTGFHQELTGRENIFLNGAILGMTRREIAQKFDEIVEFSGVEKFLDTPVKHYSSGMQVRLAFSVAAHMEPDILIVDEVLAVGDAEFQKKCMGKMEEVTEKDGRTILFVSHNLAAVEQLCKKTVVLEKGKVVFIGDTKNGIARYLNSGNNPSGEVSFDDSRQISVNSKDIIRKIGDDVVVVKRVFCHTKNGDISNDFDITKEIGITTEYEVLEEGYLFTSCIRINNENRMTIFHARDLEDEKRNVVKQRGIYRSTAWIPGNFLSEGVFFVSSFLLNSNATVNHAIIEDCLSFKTTDHLDGNSARGTYMGEFVGVVRPVLTWETKKM